MKGSHATEYSEIFSWPDDSDSSSIWDAIADAGQTPDIFIRRHQGGDWGDVCEDDAEANEMALKDNSRLLSVYHTTAKVKLYVITEWDRSATTILLPEEY